MELCRPIESKNNNLLKNKENIIIYPPEFLQAASLKKINVIARTFTYDSNDKQQTDQLKKKCLKVILRNATFQWDNNLKIKNMTGLEDWLEH